MSIMALRTVNFQVLRFQFSRHSSSSPGCLKIWLEVKKSIILIFRELGLQRVGGDGKIKSRIKGERRRKNLIYKVWLAQGDHKKNQKLYACDRVKFLFLCLVNYNAGINESKQDLNHFHSSRIENLNMSCVELNNININVL